MMPLPELYIYKKMLKMKGDSYEKSKNLSVLWRRCWYKI